MTGLAITITNAGRAALTAAKGSNAITIASVGLTAASFTPTADATSLTDQIKTLTTVSGDVPDAYTVHLSIRDESADTYKLRGFGLYLSDGTLFGIYGGGDTLIMEKATGSILLLAVDISFSESTATAITFGDTNFTDPPATTERKGVVELATNAEATTGTDTARAVTPAGMLAAVTSWLNDRFGSGAPSAFVKTLLTCASAAVMRTALELKSAALQETTAFAAAGHTHTIAQVSGLQTTLDAKLASASYTAADVLAKLVTVDGSGSGLDADTLDGLHAASFLPVAGGTMTGAITLSATNGAWNGIRYSSSYSGTTLYGACVFDFFGTFRPTIGMGVFLQTPRLSTGLYGWHFIDNDFNEIARINGAGITYGGNTVWHAGNDGAGSGLDADTLDGQQGSYYTAITARLGYTPVQQGTGVGQSGNVVKIGWSSTRLKATVDTTDIGNFVFDANLSGGGLTHNGSVMQRGGYSLWGPDNDGAGSGLDADTLDGHDSAYFLNTANAYVTSSSSSSSGGYRIWSDGFKECWGTATVAGNGQTTVTFPISFTSWAMAVVNGGNQDTDAKDNGPWVLSRTLTNMIIHNAIDSSTAIQFRAWGY